MLITIEKRTRFYAHISGPRSRNIYQRDKCAARKLYWKTVFRKSLRFSRQQSRRSVTICVHFLTCSLLSRAFLSRQYVNCDDVAFIWFLLEVVQVSNPEVSRGFPQCSHADSRTNSYHTPQLPLFNLPKIIIFKFNAI